MDALQTTSEVIDALGRTAKVSRLTGRTMQAVSNWKDRGFFPPETYPTITAALAEVGRQAEPTLWRSVPVSALTDAEARERAKPLRCFSPHGIDLPIEGQSR